MKLKSLLLTIALTLFAVSGLLAQDKYEYATLKNYFSSVVFTTATGQEVTKVPAKENDTKFLEKLNELSDKGWEVYSTSPSATGGFVETYYLRKKKSQ